MVAGTEWFLEWLLLLLLLDCALQVTRDLGVNQEVTVSVHFAAAAAQ
jgi:hypothetical protein